MIRVVVAGTSAFGLPSFSVLASAADIHVVGCISQPARPVGRHGVLTPSPVAVWANEQQLPVLTPVNWRSETDLAALREWRPDVIVVAAYGVIVPADFLAIPTYGCINLHASLLPAYRGASPIAAARKRKGKPMAIKLADELLAASKEEGEAVRKRQDVQRMAESNKAFAHFA
jgi:methionyl-tRNA formyltransferase